MGYLISTSWKGRRYSKEDTEERLGCIAEDMQEVLLRTGRDEMWSL